MPQTKGKNPASSAKIAAKRIRIANGSARSDARRNPRERKPARCDADRQMRCRSSALGDSARAGITAPQRQPGSGAGGRFARARGRSVVGRRSDENRRGSATRRRPQLPPPGSESRGARGRKESGHKGPLSLMAGGQGCSPRPCGSPRRGRPSGIQDRSRILSSGFEPDPPNAKRPPGGRFAKWLGD